PCVTEPARELERRGFTLTTIPVDEQCIIQLPKKLLPEIRLISVQLANHETGAVQPVSELTIRSANATSPTTAFHCDAAAAAGKMPISFRTLGVDALSLSAHKFHGPKGIGALILKKDIKLRPILWGGHQQRAKRPGTEPVPLIVGMATALAVAVSNMK